MLKQRYPQASEFAPLRRGKLGTAKAAKKGRYER